MVARHPGFTSVSADRSPLVDALRGLAILGIFPVNLLFFAWPQEAVANPLAWVSLDSPEFVYWSVVHVFFEQKFLTLLSLVFGISLGLMFAGGGTAAHNRRMVVLLVIGLLHAYLLWSGDILVLYAVCGMLTWPLRDLSTRHLLVSAAMLIAIPSLLVWLMGLSLTFWSSEALAAMAEYWHPAPAELAATAAVYQSDWWSQMARRIPEAWAMHTGGFVFWLWRTLGLMLLGVVIARTRAWRYLPGPSKLLLLAMLFGLPSLTMIVIGWLNLQASGFDMTYGLFAGSQWNYWGSLGLATAYALLLTAAVNSTRNTHLDVTRRLAAVGRFSLTVYLGQTIIGTSLFYGHGLGWFGQATALHLIGTCLATWITALIIIPLLRQRFSHGPAEWLWRAITMRPSNGDKPYNA